tara:strand:+ start:2742 stop:2882 length:141 start_codon:yes stop_codon:yes gene_type:complete
MRLPRKLKKKLKNRYGSIGFPIVKLGFMMVDCTKSFNDLKIQLNRL